MTDPGMADITYIEPHNIETLEKIIDKERPDALLPSLGGQKGLNTPIGKEEVYEDSYIRKSAIKYNIPYHTTTAAALAAARGIRAARENLIDVRSVQSYHRDVD